MKGKKAEACNARTQGPALRPEEETDYYLDSQTGLLVFTAHYLLRRGYCCANGCRHCPYPPEEKSR